MFIFAKLPCVTSGRFSQITSHTCFKWIPYSETKHTGIEISKMFQGSFGPLLLKVEDPYFFVYIVYLFIYSFFFFFFFFLILFTGPDLVVPIYFVHQVLKNEPTSSRAIWVICPNILRAITKFWGQLTQGPALFWPLKTHKASTVNL